MKNKEIHIGQLIKRVCKSRGLSNAEFGKRTNMSRQNVGEIFKRNDIYVKQLLSFGKVLDYNFLSEFHTVENESKKKVLLQIEIDENKLSELIKIMEDDSIYKILK